MSSNRTFRGITLSLALLLTVCCREVFAQTNPPDSFLPEVYGGNLTAPFGPWSKREGCTISTHPMPASNGQYENYIIRENFDYILSTINAKNRKTIVTATGGVNVQLTRLLGGGQQFTAHSENQVISRDGRNIAWFAIDQTATIAPWPGIVLLFSSDYGATFNPIVLPVNLGLEFSRTVGCLPEEHGGTQHLGNLAFDANGNLHVFYAGFPANAISTVVAAMASNTVLYDFGELYYAVIPPSGAAPTTARSISKLTVDGNVSSFPPQFEIVQTEKHIVFSTSVGPSYNDGVSPSLLGSVPMFVVLDTLSGRMTKISYNNSLRNIQLAGCFPRQGRYSMNSMASDGKNVYLFVADRLGSSSLSQLTNDRIIEFAPQSSNKYVFFPNTAQVGADPLVDFSSSLIPQGFALSSVIPAGWNPYIHSFGSRWGRGAQQAHQIEVFGSLHSYPNPSIPFIHLSIANPNSTTPVVTAYSAPDISDSTLQSLGFTVNSIPYSYMLGTAIPRFILGSRNMTPVGNTMISTYCRSVSAPPGWLPTPNNRVELFSYELN